MFPEEEDGSLDVAGAQFSAAGRLWTEYYTEENYAYYLCETTGHSQVKIALVWLSVAKCGRKLAMPYVAQHSGRILANMESSSTLMKTWKRRRISPMVHRARAPQ